jgi:DNA-directed RNA polymerase subunit RPC12/RpoP
MADGVISSLVEIVNCKNCAAELKFQPGTEHLVCPYCGTENQITDHTVPIEEIDYDSFLRNQYEHEEKIEVRDVKCSSCGASTVFPPNVSSIDCPYCRNSLVMEGGNDSTVLKPRAILPFRVTEEEARQFFDKWLKGKWFLPSDLKRVRRLDDKVTGIYIPYWTFDSNTFSRYSGERGVHYTTTVPVPTVVNGKTVIRQQVVTKTRWTHVSGNVNVLFDDTLIVASTSLPEKYIEMLEPFDLHNLVPFDERFLAGFRTEIYQLGVKGGFEKVKVKMGVIIRAQIRADIGGDVQRIHSSHTEFNDVTFKHILLPIWVSAYRYNDKIYRFLINARTGETHGERPYDKWKIAITVLLGILVAVTIAVIVKYTQG